MFPSCTYALRSPRALLRPLQARNGARSTPSRPLNRLCLGSLQDSQFNSSFGLPIPYNAVAPDFRPKSSLGVSAGWLIAEKTTNPPLRHPARFQTPMVPLLGIATHNLNEIEDNVPLHKGIKANSTISILVNHILKRFEVHQTNMTNSSLHDSKIREPTNSSFVFQARLPLEELRTTNSGRSTRVTPRSPKASSL